MLHELHTSAGQHWKTEALILNTPTARLTHRSLSLSAIFLLQYHRFHTGIPGIWPEYSVFSWTVAGKLTLSYNLACLSVLSVSSTIFVDFLEESFFLLRVPYFVTFFLHHLLNIYCIWSQLCLRSDFSFNVKNRGNVFCQEGSVYVVFLQLGREKK